MNRITYITAIALSFAAAGTAFADDITIDTTPHAALKSRAEVQAELASYKQARVNPWSTSYNPSREIKEPRSRADVMAETKAAVANGSVAAITSEDSGSTYLAQARRPAAGNTLILAQKSGN